jgi:hypothetical protein
MSNSAMRSGSSSSAIASPPKRAANASPRPLRDEVGRRQLHHLAHAHQQQARAREIPEHVLRELERRGRHRDRMRAQGGLRADFLRHGEGVLEELAQLRAEAAHGFGGAHRVLHLPQDLRLPQHHRIEPRGDAEGMPHRGFAIVVVEARCDFHARAARARLEPTAHGAGVIDPAIDLGAVAGRDQHRLGHPGLRGQFRQGFRLPLGREGELFPHVQRSALVVQAEDVERHGAKCLIDWKL